MQKMVEFYHNKGIDMLKLGHTLCNLANICLHSSSSSNFYPVTENDKDLLSKFVEDKVAGPSIVFTRKSVVDETHIRKSTNVCKTIVGRDASLLYPYSMCQPMPTGIYTRYEFDAEMQKFNLRQNKSRNFENTVMLYFQRFLPESGIESFYTAGTQKKIDWFNADEFCGYCNPVFAAMGSFYFYCSCEEARLALTGEDVQRGTKKRKRDQIRRQYIEERSYTVVEMWE